MTLNITGTLVPDNAAAGTLIGVVSSSTAHTGVASYQLQSNPNGYFVMSAKGELYVAWIGSALVGNYPIRVHGHGPGWNEYANFSIRVVPTPVAVQFSAPAAATPLADGGWRVVTDDGDTLDVHPSVTA